MKKLLTFSQCKNLAAQKLGFESFDSIRHSVKNHGDISSKVCDRAAKKFGSQFKNALKEFERISLNDLFNLTSDYHNNMPAFSGKEPEFLMLLDFVKHVRNYMVTIAKTGQRPVIKLDKHKKAVLSTKPEPGHCDLCNNRLKAGDLVNPTDEYMKYSPVLIGGKWVNSSHFFTRIKEIEHKRSMIPDGPPGEYYGSSHVCLATLSTGTVLNVNWLKK